MDTEKFDPEDLEVLRARHKDIKDARKSFINTILGLSGGSIILSITFLKDMAPNRLWLPALFVAWFFFMLSVATCLFELWQLVRVSIVYQLNIVERYLTKQLEAKNMLHRNSQLISPFHFYALVFFGCGAIALAIFALRNALG